MIFLHCSENQFNEHNCCSNAIVLYNLIMFLYVLLNFLFYFGSSLSIKRTHQTRMLQQPVLNESDLVWLHRDVLLLCLPIEQCPPCLSFLSFIHQDANNQIQQD